MLFAALLSAAVLCLGAPAAASKWWEHGIGPSRVAPEHLGRAEGLTSINELEERGTDPPEWRLSASGRAEGLAGIDEHGERETGLAQQALERPERAEELGQPR